MQRFLAPLPAQYDISQLRTAVIAQWPAVVDVNIVTTDIPRAAAYVPDSVQVPQATVTQFTQLVANHVPVADPTPQNIQTLQQRAQAALTTNANFIAIASPSNVQIAQQVQALTKENTALIRLLLGLFDSTSGT